VNNRLERMWKEAAVAYLRCCAGIYGTYRKKKKIDKCQSIKAVFEPRFEPGTVRIRSTSANPLDCDDGFSFVEVNLSIRVIIDKSHYPDLSLPTLTKPPQNELSRCGVTMLCQCEALCSISLHVKFLR
jgi:hypothetical protein